MENRAMKEVAIQLSNIKKQYKLGQIGGGTLQADIQTWWAKIRGKEDPNSVIGQEQRLVGQSFMALNGIDLTIYKGEALGIIGGNGAGKSTLLKLLSRVTAPTEGTIDLYGRVASMLEVGTGFNPEMTGRENVYMNGTILGMTKAEIDSKMEEIIEFSEVREFIDTPVKRYSSGMYVKLAFSVAAHLDSEIMIMDEVLAVGDMAFQKKCLSKMRSIAKEDGRTVLYVSHNMNTIRQLCDRCVVLEQGKIKYIGDVETAIAIYLGNNDNKQTYFKYTESFHLKSKLHKNFRINSMKIFEKDDTKFQCNDTIKLLLSCRSLIRCDDVRIRFEIKFHDGTLAGIMLSESGFNFLENEELDVLFQMNLEHLAPGKYSVDIVAFQYDDLGVEQYLDGVYPGMLFEIDDRINEKNKLVWLHQYWGHVRFHDLKVIKEK